MPTRIIREGINDSRAINSLSEQSELFYRRLILIVDDYGRYEADPILLRAECFKRRIDDWPVERVRQCLADVGQCRADDGLPLVSVWHCRSTGKDFLQVNNFKQRTRTASRYPDPPNATLSDNVEQMTDNVTPIPDTGYRIPKANTVSRANGNGHNPTSADELRPAVSGWPADACEEWAGAMYKAHPKKKNRVLAEQEAVRVWASMRDPPAESAEIARVHRLWCRTTSWTEKQGQYCPQLAEWLADKGYLSEPPEVIDAVDMLMDREAKRL